MFGSSPYWDDAGPENCPSRSHSFRFCAHTDLLYALFLHLSSGFAKNIFICIFFAFCAIHFMGGVVLNIKNIQWKKLLLCIALPLAVGGLSALLTRNSMKDFSALNQPPLSPPGWLFPVVWTILFTLMGIASYLVLQAPDSHLKPISGIVYGLQLLFNFFWSMLFFNWQLYWVAFVWLVILELLIFVNMVLFYSITKPAGLLLVPYFLWVAFAGYLNVGIALLN
jgi:tryptophan-rich sensory protein